MCERACAQSVFKTHEEAQVNKLVSVSFSAAVLSTIASDVESSETTGTHSAKFTACVCVRARAFGLQRMEKLGK